MITANAKVQSGPGLHLASRLEKEPEDMDKETGFRAIILSVQCHGDKENQAR